MLWVVIVVMILFDFLSWFPMTVVFVLPVVAGGCGYGSIVDFRSWLAIRGCPRWW
jgi:hypothetical protein